MKKKLTKRLKHVGEGLLNAIASPVDSPNKHRMVINKNYYLLLKKMEDYAQDLAELVVRYFKEKDLDVRKDLILKSVEVLKLNPPPGPGIVAIKDYNRHGFLNRKRAS